MVVSWLNVGVEETRGEKMEAGCKLTASRAQEPSNFVRETNGSCINGGELNHYTSRLRDEMQIFL